MLCEVVLITKLDDSKNARAKIPNKPGGSRSDADHVSLVTYGGVVMSIIVGLALLSMMSSMFVSETLDGDAAHINIAGSLRMHSVRLSRALTLGPEPSSGLVESEIMQFEQRLQQLESKLGSQLQKNDIAQIHQTLVAQWITINDNIHSATHQAQFDHTMIDQFVATIDQLVLTLQHRSEAKIRMLRIIQSSSMFLILLTAFVSLQKMTKLVVQPMNQLVRAAREAGRGNFSIKVRGNTNNEIGVLARTFNDMSEQLQAMHKQFEQRVQDKTSQLEQSNRSLELLYQTSHNLVRPKREEDLRTLLQQIEDNLGHGTLTLCLTNEHGPDSVNWLTPISNHGLARFCEGRLGGCKTCLQHSHSEHNFEIKKRREVFGTLRYSSNDGTTMEQWKSQLLQAIADNIAVAISHDKRRKQDHLIGLQEERAVIARELHDSLAQSLSYLKLQTGLLSKQLQKELARDVVEATISDIRAGLSDAYRQLRELLTTFRLQINGASLETALTTTAIEFSQKCSHPVTLNCAIDTSLLSANEQIHVLQIVREALSNVQRHAQAKQAQIDLDWRDNKIQVRVSDDGTGLQPEPNPGSHHGMSIMRERAGSLGAQLDIESNSMGGTTVNLIFTASARQTGQENDGMRHTQSEEAR
jgi:two-component system nitrate/nitrite sensor histidine kinase NarX